MTARTRWFCGCLVSFIQHQGLRVSRICEKTPTHLPPGLSPCWRFEALVFCCSLEMVRCSEPLRDSCVKGAQLVGVRRVSGSEGSFPRHRWAPVGFWLLRKPVGLTWLRTDGFLVGSWCVPRASSDPCASVVLQTPTPLLRGLHLRNYVFMQH